MRRRPALLLAGFVPALVLACDPGGFFPFGPAKWLALTAGLPAAVAVLLARRPLRFAVRPTAAVAALVLAMAVAAVVGEDPLYAWIGTPERHLGVLTWLLVAVAFVAGQSTTDEDRRTLATGGVVAGAGLGLAAVLEALEWWPHTLDAGARLGGTFGSPAYLGAGVALLLPVAVGVLADPAWSRGWRVAAGAAVAVLTFAAVGSGARAGWFGLAVGLAATAFARRDRLPGRRALLVGAAATVAGVGLLVVATPAGDRLSSAFDTDSAGGAPGRFDEWRVAGRTLAEHPVTGAGPEGYRIAFADGVDAAYEAEHGRVPLPDRAHSAPLDIALTGGALGLSAWLALVGLLVRPVRAALGGREPWLVGIGAGLVGYLGGQLLLFPLAEVEPVAAVLAGALLASQRDAPGGGRGWARPRVVPRLALGGLALVTVGALAAGGLDLAADREADEAAEAINQFRPDDAVAHARRAVDLRPDVLRAHLLLAATLEADQQGVVAALGAVEDALDLSPGDPLARRRHVELLVERANATRVPGHIDDARAELGRLLDDDPLDTEYWILTGVVARLDGDVEAARAAFQQASAIDPGNPVPAVALVQLEVEAFLLAVAGDGTG